jgi:hypothetical protein
LTWESSSSSQTSSQQRHWGQTLCCLLKRPSR